MYFKQVGKSEIKVAKAQIEAFGKALDQYRLDTGRYPSTEQGLQALVTKPVDEVRWDGPYLKKGVPLDQWGSPYSYTSPGQHGDFDIFSLGKGKSLGGVGGNAAIVSWE